MDEEEKTQSSLSAKPQVDPTEGLLTLRLLHPFNDLQPQDNTTNQHQHNTVAS
jgi:hypothetical protein